MKLRPRRQGLTAALASLATALTLGIAPPAQGNPSHVDPGAWPRDADPRVPYLVRNTLHDGERAIEVPRARHRADLWRVRGGYVLVDQVRNRQPRWRITSVRPDGRRAVIARPRMVDASAVSPDRRRLAFTAVRGASQERTTIKVVHPMTGEVIAQRRFRYVRLLAVTGNRVLFSRMGYRNRTDTRWWNYRRDSVRRISTWEALYADVANDRVVFSTQRSDFTGCGRVARLSRPRGTLWRTCRQRPHAWSPGGGHALSTHVYFDMPGTDRWVVRDGRTGERGAQVNGRLSWDVAWEDENHFLTTAQSDDGKSAIIRCTVAGMCSRASRLWDREVDEDFYFVGPPVLLASN